MKTAAATHFDGGRVASCLTLRKSAVGNTDRSVIGGGKSMDHKAPCSEATATNMKTRANYMKSIKAVIIGLALAAPTLGWAAGGVALSPHDMSTNAVWNTRKGLC